MGGAVRKDLAKVSRTSAKSWVVFMLLRSISTVPGMNDFIEKLLAHAKQFSHVGLVSCSTGESDRAVP